MRSLKMLPWAALSMALALVASPVSAEEPEAQDATRVSVASDPAAWILDGYSGVVMVEPAGMPQWRITVEVFGLTYPQSVVELSEANEGHGWKREVEVSGVLYADCHPTGDGEGWHLGGGLNFMFSRLSREGRAEESALTSLELLVRGGYRWFPLDGSGLFVDPWAGLGALVVLDEPKPIDGQSFEELPAQALATVHVGWRY